MRLLALACWMEEETEADVALGMDSTLPAEPVPPPFPPLPLLFQGAYGSWAYVEAGPSQE